MCIRDRWERNPAEGRKRLEEIRQLTRGALAEMRTLLFELRPAALEDVPIRDLLKQLADAVTGRARIPVELQINGDCEMSAEVKISLYRICQEALNNITKHAHAASAKIILTCNDVEETVELTITDDGQGFDMNSAHPGHLGLNIMKERAAAIKAEMDITSALGKGTQVTVRWRYPEDILN